MRAKWVVLYVALLLVLGVIAWRRHYAVRAQPSDAVARKLEPADRGAAPTAALEPAADAGALAQQRLALTPLASPNAAADADAVRGIAGVVLDTRGLPLADAPCVLSPSEPAAELARYLPRADVAALRAISDARGEFRFDVRAGFWQLDVSAPGFAAWRRANLACDQRIEVRLRAALDLRVRTRRPDGAPLAGAELSLVANFRDPLAHVYARATSDANGEALLRDAPPGSWYVVARERASALRIAPIELVEAARDTTAELEIVLEPGIALHGNVRELGGAAPIAAARVKVEAYTRGVSLALDTRSDEHGAFATEPVFAAGETVVVSASASAHARSSVDAFVAPESDERSAIVVELAPNAGRAVGRVVDADGRACAGAQVLGYALPTLSRGLDGIASALQRLSPYAERWEPLAVSGADGRFEVDALALDRQHVLMLQAEAHAPRLCWVPLLLPGEIADLGDIEVLRGAALFGELHYADGAPAADVFVRARPELIVQSFDRNAWRPSQWWRPLEHKTADDGSFRFDLLSPGSFTLECGGQLLGDYTLRAGEPQGPLHLVVARKDSVPSAQLSGRVRDRNGAELRGMFVALIADAPAAAPAAAPADAAVGAGATSEPQKPAAMTFSQLDGSYRLRAPRDASYRLRVTDPHGGFVPFEEPLRLPESGATRDVELTASTVELQPLIVVVLGQDGRPAVGIDAALEPPEGRSCGCLAFRKTSDENGMIVFDRIADAEHRLVVTDPQGRYVMQQREALRAGGYVEIVLSYL